MLHVVVHDHVHAVSHLGQLAFITPQQLSFMVPLLAVYFAAYLINQGITPHPSLRYVHVLYALCCIEYAQLAATT